MPRPRRKRSPPTNPVADLVRMLAEAANNPDQREGMLRDQLRIAADVIATQDRLLRRLWRVSRVYLVLSLFWAGGTLYQLGHFFGLV